MGKTIGWLIDHVKIEHQGQPASTDRLCTICDRRFINQNGLIRHMVCHNESKPFTCKVCGRSFSQNQNLRGHMRQHTGEKPFQCEHCGKRFTHNISLRKHLCTALGKRIEPLDQKQEGLGRPKSSTRYKQVKAATGSDN